MSQKVLPSKIGFNPNGTRTPAGARVSLVPSHHATLKSFSGFRAGAPLCSPAVVGSASPTVARRSRALQPVRALFEKFTERSIKSVMLAQEMSRTCGAMEVGPEHILLGLIAEDSSKAGFLGCGVTPETARAVVESLHEPRRARGSAAPKDLPFSTDAKQLFEAALLESRRMGMSFIAPEHIFLAVAASREGPAVGVMAAMGLDVERLKDEAERRLKGEAEGEGLRNKVAAAAAAGTSSRAGKKDGPSALEEFCRNLNEEAAAERTDPVIGRTKEVARVAQILARRSKNNPILLGEPGVGKTAIAEGLARAIVSGALPDGSVLPDFLLGKRVMSLDLGLLIAGAKERGELESRITRLMAECRETGNVILVIDEIHTLVGAGAVGRGGSGGGGGLDIANILKPALARGELQCIGATTLDEHRKYIEKDAALERRFQPVMVAEPSEDDSLLILEGLIERYESHHRCIYSSDALLAAVRLSSRYVADRNLPDKAIDLIDEAGSRVCMAAHAARKAAGGDTIALAAASYAELRQVMGSKNEAARDLLYEEAALLRSWELELKAKLSGEPEEAPVVPVVDVSHIEAVVSAWTGIPVDKMGDDDRERLLGLSEALRDRVIGQDEAVEATARAVARAASGLKHPSRPIAAVIFAGPTGVGKSLLARELAEAHFGIGQAHPMVRLDMSEYMERHSVSKLIGAPPGYVGYGEGGKLTEAVRRRPFSLVLFDEIEKAHPDVFNILLQVIEDGRLTDSAGRVVSFKNTLIVLTTNVGSAVVAKGGTGAVGFQLDSPGDKEASHGRLRSLVLEELKNYFRPELLNRMDEVVVFHRLQRPELAKIAHLEVAKTAERAAERGIGLRVDPSAVDLVIEEGYSEEMGARELRRAVTRLLDDELSEAILSGAVKAGEVAIVRRRPGTTRSVEVVPLSVVEAEAAAATVQVAQNVNA